MAAEWYYAEDGQQIGPVTLEQMQQRAAAGLLRPADLVWNAGLTDWVQASTQPGLFAAGSAPSTIPPPRPRYEDGKTMNDPGRRRAATPAGEFCSLAAPESSRSS